MKIPAAEHEARLAQALQETAEAHKELLAALARRMSAEAGTGSAKAEAEREMEHLRNRFEGKVDLLNLARVRFVQAWGQLPAWAL